MFRCNGNLGKRVEIQNIIFEDDNEMTISPNFEIDSEVSDKKILRLISRRVLF